MKDYAAGINTLPALLADYEKNPDDADINFKLAEKYQDRYERDKTIPYYQKVLELDPNDVKGHKNEATYQVALFEASTNKNVEPLKAFIATTPDEKYLANAYSTLASTYSRNKDTDNMIATYEEAIKALPENGRMMIYYSEAIIRGRIDDKYPLALELNEKAKVLDPGMELSSVLNLVSYYTNIEDKDKVVETFENAIAANPDSTRLNTSYASSINSMEIVSKYDKGIEIMENALAADPEAVYMNYTLGLLYHKKGELEKAIAAVKKALDKNPTHKVYSGALAKMEKELKETK